MSGTSQAPTIDLVSIQPSRSFSQTNNAQVLLKGPKAIHPNRAAEQGSLIRELPLNSEKNNYSQGQGQYPEPINKEPLEKKD